MEEIIRVNNQFYVLATSSLADDRTRVLKYGETFAVFNRLGDIESMGLGEQGLYHRETRYLSRLTFRLGHSVPQLLRSTIQEDNAFLTLDMMNPDVYSDGTLNLPRGSLHVFRSKFLWGNACFEKIRVSNFSLNSTSTLVSFEFGADYADIFQVRGTKREYAGELLTPVLEKDSVILCYQGKDNVLRRTRIEFSPSPLQLTPDTATYRIHIDAKQETSIEVITHCEEEGQSQTKMFGFGDTMTHALKSLGLARSRFCGLRSSNAAFNAWLSRSEADVHMMINGNPEGAYPYAGVPWFSTVFGRDGIWTALECLWVAPWIAKDVLKFLAQSQATEIIPEQEAEPGKIIHEMRRGEMANLKEIPFGRYYGSIDSTPLFVMLAGAYYTHSGDLSFIQSIWPNVLAALEWIDHHGDLDNDGFIEYQARDKKGLVHQGWKDSHDSVFHKDGKLALAPIALCEVQAYVYSAKLAGSVIAEKLGQVQRAAELRTQAKALQANFEREFWDDELNMYVLALDAEKKPCRVRSSNAGHALYTGVASQEHAGRLIHSLFQEDMNCGWGIRTLSSNEIRYNPMSYHNGSVWPHDNAIIAGGMARYGYKENVCMIMEGLFEASKFMELNRLPELFCGFHKRSEVEGPTLYPVACSPQSWAAGSAYLLLAACLGITVKGGEDSVVFSDPFLAPFLSDIVLKKIQVGSETVDVRVIRTDGDTELDILSNKANLNVALR